MKGEHPGENYKLERIDIFFFFNFHFSLTATGKNGMRKKVTHNSKEERIKKKFLGILKGPFSLFFFLIQQI